MDLTEGLATVAIAASESPASESECAASESSPEAPDGLSVPLPFLANDQQHSADDHSATEGSVRVSRTVKRAVFAARGMSVVTLVWVFVIVYVGAALRSSCASVLINTPNVYEQESGLKQQVTDGAVFVGPSAGR